MWRRKTESGCPPIDLDEGLAASLIAAGQFLVRHTASTVELESLLEVDQEHVAT